MLTGICGEGWKKAAAEVSKKIRFDITVCSMGPGSDFTICDFQWGELQEVDESGVILLRPDLFVGWRA